MAVLEPYIRNDNEDVVVKNPHEYIANKLLGELALSHTNTSFHEVRPER